MALSNSLMNCPPTPPFLAPASPRYSDSATLVMPAPREGGGPRPRRLPHVLVRRPSPPPPPLLAVRRTITVMCLYVRITYGCTCGDSGEGSRQQIFQTLGYSS